MEKLSTGSLTDGIHSTKSKTQSFRDIIEYVNPLAISKIPKSGNTIRNDILKCFEIGKLTIKENLNSAKSKIHISFDLWSSPNYKAVVALCGHWISDEFKVETALLGIKEIIGKHKGEYIAPVLHQIVKEFGIQDKLGYFMADNASNNDSAIKFLE